MFCSPLFTVISRQKSAGNSIEDGRRHSDELLHLSGAGLRTNSIWPRHRIPRVYIRVVDLPQNIFVDIDRAEFVRQAVKTYEIVYSGYRFVVIFQQSFE